jgi:hypothetical protein
MVGRVTSAVQFRSEFACLVEGFNAGKSTLTNALVAASWRSRRAVRRELAELRREGDLSVVS